MVLVLRGLGFGSVSPYKSGVCGSSVRKVRFTSTCPVSLSCPITFRHYLVHGSLHSLYVWSLMFQSLNIYFITQLLDRHRTKRDGCRFRVSVEHVVGRRTGPSMGLQTRNHSPTGTFQMWTSK